MVTIRHADKTDYAVLPSVEADAAQAFKEHGLAAIAEIEPAPAEFYARLPENAAVFVAEEKKHDRAIVGFAVMTELDGQAYLKEISVRRAASGSEMLDARAKSFTCFKVASPRPRFGTLTMRSKARPSSGWLTRRR